MTSDNLSDDLRLARKICKELRAQNTYAITELYLKFHEVFICYARVKIYKYITSPDRVDSRVESVLSKFWIELLNGKTICKYKAKTQSSFQWYLCKSLGNRIIDDFRSFKVKEDREAGDLGLLQKTDANPSPETGTVSMDQKQKQSQVIDDALSMLEKNHPKDADLIRLRLLEELSYKQIVQKQLKGRHVTDRDLKNKVEALKKRFTRKGAGSKDRFKICLDRCLKKHNLSRDDII